MTEGSLSPLQLRLRETALGKIVEERRALLTAIGADPRAFEPIVRIGALWEELAPLHPRVKPLTSQDFGAWQSDKGFAEQVKSITGDFDMGARCTLLFTYTIPTQCRFVAWRENWVGALECDLGVAIGLIDKAIRIESPLMTDEIAVAAKDRSWAIWLEGGEIRRTSI
jgi:hypothetical protein